jgi:hypothetical protein
MDGEVEFQKLGVKLEAVRSVITEKAPAALSF